MLYFLFIIGLILFLYGFNKNRRVKKDFELFYHESSEKEEIKRVNHTLNEEALKKDIDFLYLEVEKLKRESENQKESANKEKEQAPMDYKELLQKIKVFDESTLEELSKEMKIGKGELLLLKNLSKK